jgi:hydrophobe/amphiphile efflux-1 (HAE1) family protein
MRNISAWAIRNPILPIVLFVVLLFSGIVAFWRLPVTLDPDIAYPVVSVTVSQPGAAPQEIENQILQKVEGSIAGVGNIHTMASSAREGIAFIEIEFLIGTPIDRAVADVRDAVSKVRSQLPQGIQEPVVQREDVDGGAFVYYALSSTVLPQRELSWFVDNALTKRLLVLPGVAQVSRGGGLSREIRVELDPARMQALGVTAVAVNQQLQSLNLDSPGGRAQVGGGEQSIRVLGGAHTANALGDTQIILPGGRFARLSDLAVVRDSYAEVRNIARLDGRPATTFAVYKAKGFSDVTVYDRVQKELDKVRAENPQVQISQIFTTVEVTQRGYTSAMSALIEGSILAVLVVLLFLRDVRATLISALAIPLSAIPTFAFMQWMDFSLNSISLLGVSLVAGVLVDDAIVEIENIVRHMRMGKSGFQAALDAADQIGLAVVATSATIIAVFLPVSFMGGITGQYFKQFGLTVAAAVFFSLLVARLITPVIAAYTLSADGLPSHSDGPVMRNYMALLSWCISNRWKTLLAGTAFFALSIYALSLVPMSFVPETDFGTSFLNIELPPGVRMEQTSEVSSEIYRIVSREPEVKSVLEMIGGDEGGEVRSASIDISLVPRSERHVSQQEWQQRISARLRQIPDIRFSFQKTGGGGGNTDVTLYVTGDDPPQVEAQAHKIVDQMSALPILRDVRINGDLQRPEILIRPRLDLAAQLGVTVASISQTIRIATLGDIDANSAKFSLSDRQVPIRVSLLEDSRRDLATLQNLPVPTAMGTAVPLKEVADISFGQGPSRIRRYNQSRRIAIEANFRGVELGPAMKAIHALPAVTGMPRGVRLVDVGVGDLMNELVVNFVVAMATGLLMVFAVLVLLFVRVLQPLTILSSLPLSIGGAALALLALGYSLSLGVMIGFLMLMGIVAKNAILLVDFAIEEIRAGKDQTTALLEAGHKRARPIVMTTVAMVAGMLPIAVGLGGDSAFRGPMAIAVIGGLITSTGLTLVIVPAAFTLVDDIEGWFGPRIGRLITAQRAMQPVGTALQPPPAPAP